MSAQHFRDPSDPSNPKPFTDVSAQLSILEERGLRFSDKAEAEKYLLRENYYAVVNGYKDAFIDRQASNLANDDRYEEGSTFEDLARLYAFDKALRAETFRILLDAEAGMKTDTVYAFCDVHRGVDDYLDPACYCPKASYRNPAYYTRGLIRLLSMLDSVRDNGPQKPYITHYVEKYHCLPLWVASRCLSFGTMSAFFDYQQQSVKTKTCVTMAKALGVSVVRQRDLEFAYHILPDFRNICAHGERLYNAKLGKNNDRSFDEMLRALKTVTTAERLSEYAKVVDALIAEVASANLRLEAKVLLGMNVSRDDIAALIIN